MLLEDSQWHTSKLVSDKNMADKRMCGWGRHWRTPLCGKMHVVLRLVRPFGLLATAGDLGCVAISEELHHKHTPAVQIVTLFVSQEMQTWRRRVNLEVKYLTN